MGRFVYQVLYDDGAMHWVSADRIPQGTILQFENRLEVGTKNLLHLPLLVRWGSFAL